MKSPQQRLDAMTDKRGPLSHKKACKLYPEIAGTRCWEFTGFKDGNGYGKIYYINKVVSTHILAWILKYGIVKKAECIKNQLCVLHKCDNPSCRRPLHLFLGTRTLNNLDKLNKKRHSRGLDHSLATIGTKPYRPGQKNPNAKLTDKEAKHIRELYATGNYRQQDLADMYNVTQPNIGYIVRKESFANV